MRTSTLARLVFAAFAVSTAVWPSGSASAEQTQGEIAAARARVQSLLNAADDSALFSSSPMGLPQGFSAAPAPEGKAVFPDIVRQKLEKIIAERYSYYENFFHELHEHPETAFQEKWTSAKLVAELQSMGFAVTTGIGGTGYVAIYKNGPGPVAMIRTELDALPVEEENTLSYRSRVPGKSHVCGHDLHMTIQMATAYALLQLKDHWHGTLMAVGQPAEETAQGANAMIADGLFTRFPKPDYALSIHTRGPALSGKIAYHSGVAQSAADFFNITLYGKGGHGARPDLTIDPIMMAAELLTRFQTLRHEVNPLVPSVISIGYLHGGTAQNVIPPSVELRGTIRSYSEEVRQFLKSRVIEATQNLAASYHAPAPKIEFTGGISMIYNDPAFTAKMVPVLEAAVGKENVGEEDLVMPSDDFSQYHAVGGFPTLKYSVGITPTPGPDAPDNHNPRFVVDFGPSFKNGWRTMVAAVISQNQPQGKAGLARTRRGVVDQEPVKP